MRDSSEDGSKVDIYKQSIRFVCVPSSLMKRAGVPLKQFLWEIFWYLLHSNTHLVEVFIFCAQSFLDFGWDCVTKPGTDLNTRGDSSSDPFE